jgi:shikimate kinase
VAGAGTVWLVGMMGAGKSTVGRVLAARLGRAFVDTDEEIERRAGRAIAEIFAREGEAGFRTRELAVVEACRGRGAVVALGGGAVTQPAVRERLRGCGTVVYLRARPETLLARVGDASERPLLAGLAAEARLARLRELLAQREPAYAGAALAVDVDAAAVDEVVERIAAELGLGMRS